MSKNNKITDLIFNLSKLSSNIVKELDSIESDIKSRIKSLNINEKFEFISYIYRIHGDSLKCCTKRLKKE